MGVELQLYRMQIGCHAARVFRVGRVLKPDSTRDVVRCAAIMSMAIMLGLSCGVLICALTSPGIAVFSFVLTSMKAAGNSASFVCQCNSFAQLTDSYAMAAERNIWGGTSALNTSAGNCMLGEGYQWNKSGLLFLSGDLELNPGPLEKADL